ncbi:RNA polymerase-binding protein RbpA [Actinophytocola xanthii]|uniref:RNA polymerase-binding protein RbpA n=1 Tax=Actinophytocola xanthii TaxID=1912961 RepID=A0A1Q8BTV6_9PSEU|nr:hypothetical protein BU204_37040 [Actinophytocola xanthii]
MQVTQHVALCEVSVRGEPQTGIGQATRVALSFYCERGHALLVYFAADAELPAGWECPQHGTVAGEPLAARRGRGRRRSADLSHWGALRARRTDHELDALLEETLAALQRRDGPRRRSVPIGGRLYVVDYNP